MKATIPTAALVALYLSLASSAAAAGAGGSGSLEALLSRVASQHSKAQPSNTAEPSLVAVTTAAEPLPTVLQPGAVVFNPKQHDGPKSPPAVTPSGALSGSRMAKKVRAKRSQEEPAPQALFALGKEAEKKEREKRWIWAHSIIQDGMSGGGIPTDGSNANLLSATPIAMDTPQETIAAPSFPPVSSPTPASAAPAASSSAVPVVHVAVASSASVAPAAVASSVVAPVVDAASSASSLSAPAAAVPSASASASAPAAKVFAGAAGFQVIPAVVSTVVSPVAQLASVVNHPVVASSASLPSVPSAATATTKLFSDVHHHRHGQLAVTNKAKHHKMAAAHKDKRWVWGSSIIQDGDAPVSQHETPQAEIVTPTFPPLAEATASVLAAFSASAAATTSAPVSVAAVEALALESAVNLAAVVASTSTSDAVAPAATTTAAAVSTGDWIEERLAAIAEGFKEAEEKVESVFAREKRGYREMVMAVENQKRVEKIVRRAIN